MGLALGRDLPDHNIIGFHVGTNSDDPTFIQVLQGIFPNIGDIPGDFLFTLLGVTSLHLKFFNMNGGVHIFFNQLFTNDDGILKVVTTPRHERHKNISP